MSTVTVRIENTYVCGRTSSNVIEVTAPPIVDDAWWDDHVLEHTGDGHPCGATEDATYDARIIDAPADSGLVGQTHSWGC